jgi:hypothetical protein
MNRSRQPLLWFGVAVLLLGVGWAFIRAPRKHFRHEGPKPYEVAIYEVYSDLLRTELTDPWFERLIDPIPEEVLIRIETRIEEASYGPKTASLIGDIKPQEQFDKELSSAAEDYVRRNKKPFLLQKKFSLPKYDLITTAEEEAVLNNEGRDQEGCREFMRNHPNYHRWVELSAVGFNEDQTVAYLYIAEWSGSTQLCKQEVSGHGGLRILRKRLGEWHIVDTGRFTDWIT